jgi:hypothetical protein
MLEGLLLLLLLVVVVRLASGVVWAKVEGMSGAGGDDNLSCR